MLCFLCLRGICNHEGVTPHDAQAETLFLGITLCRGCAVLPEKTLSELLEGLVP